MHLYQSFNSQHEIDWQYNAILSADNIEFYALNNTNARKDTREAMVCYADIQYGEAAGQTLDIFPATNENTPVILLFVGEKQSS